LNYFDEKEGQIAPSTLQAFGIEINSRYGKGYEIIEMINFAEKAAKCNICQYVKSIFYDTKANMCVFEFTQNLPTEINNELEQIALATIGQFTWDEVVRHGKPLGDIGDELY